MSCKGDCYNCNSKCENLEALEPVYQAKEPTPATHPIKCSPDICKVCKWGYVSTGRIGYGNKLRLANGRLIRISCDYMYQTGKRRGYEGSVKLTDNEHCVRFELDPVKYEEFKLDEQKKRKERK